MLRLRDAEVRVTGVKSLHKIPLCTSAFAETTYFAALQGTQVYFVRFQGRPSTPRHSETPDGETKPRHTLMFFEKYKPKNGSQVDDPMEKSGLR